jgi:hypothetical protein
MGEVYTREEPREGAAKRHDHWHMLALIIGSLLLTALGIAAYQ